MKREGFDWGLDEPNSILLADTLGYWHHRWRLSGPRGSDV